MENKTLEQNFERLDEIIKQMENGSLSLEALFELYKEGTELVKDCTDRLDTVEKKIRIINGEGEVPDGI